MTERTYGARRSARWWMRGMAAKPTRAMQVVAVALSAAAALLVLMPFAAYLVLAAWFADLLGPAQRRLERLLGGKRRGAAALVVLFVLVVILPLAGIALALVPGVRRLVEQVRAALEGGGSLGGALLGPAGDELGDLAALATRYGENVWRTLSSIAHASATAAIAVLVFVAALYAFLADGDRAYAWLVRRAPISPESCDRLAGAFGETGRGLLVAGAGTACVQGAVATVTYLALGIPRAVLLGPLTAVCAIVPAIGTAVVWLPLAIELAVSGAYARAVLLVGAGLFIGVVDNLVRPTLARRGRLSLPTVVVLVSMLGGVTVLGPAGVLLGPLVVRLATEALDIVLDDSSSGDARSTDDVARSESRPGTSNPPERS